jgi:hypothetical protein
LPQPLPLTARPAPPVVPAPAPTDTSEDLEVLPDDLPALPDFEASPAASEAEADSSSASDELIVIDEPGTPPGGEAPPDLEITAGFSQPSQASQPAKKGLEIGGLDGTPDERVPIDTPGEDLFDRNYKDLSSPSDDISIDLEVEPQKKGK